MTTLGPRSPAEYAQLVQANPGRARRWLDNVITTAGTGLPESLRASLTQLTSLAPDSFSMAGNSDAVASLFQVAASTAWVLPSHFPPLQGTLRVERGSQVVLGAQGYREWPELKLTLTTPDGRTFVLQSDNDQSGEIFSYVPGTDVMAFDGMPVSVRGWVDSSGQTVRVTEFTAGHHQDFVTGRVSVQGDKVFIKPRGRDVVEIRNPDLKAQLINRRNLGVILNCKVMEESVVGRKSLFIDGDPGDYWILIKYNALPTPRSGDLAVSEAPATAATSSSHPTVVVPTAEVPKIEVGDRMYVLGRFDGNTFLASKATSSAGSPWTTAKGPRGDPLKTLLLLADAS
jgi:hypothetical protein